MEHRDSTGTSGKLSAGWVQYMDAARGVVHSETPSEEFQKTGGCVHAGGTRVAPFATLPCPRNAVALARATC